MKSANVTRYAAGLIRYDRARHRLWVGPQRLHHGLTGALITTAGFGGLVAHLMTRRGGLQWAFLGTVLMAHDWHDRTAWFRPGSQE